MQRMAALIGVNRPTVWRSQQRFTEEGVEGLLRDQTRKPSNPPMAAKTVMPVVVVMCAPPL